MKHPIEADDSWNAYLDRHCGGSIDDVDDEEGRTTTIAAEEEPSSSYRRRLSKPKAEKDDNKQQHDKHRHHSIDDDDDEIDPIQLEKLKFAEDLRTQQVQQASQSKKQSKAEKKRLEAYNAVYQSPGIARTSAHGLMIDAGSTGSRMHVYEFEPRVLNSKVEVAAAVSGRKLTFPGTESRWTARLSPGISEFADIEDDALLEEAIANYLEPLLSFAKAVLASKESEFSNFPIFLKATAGLRIIPSKKRQRVISTVRKLFANDTYCPFWDETERVRVISGEEEAVYGWAGVNFLLGNLMKNSEGVGEAYGGAIQTFGALDMGGASSQISFFQPEGDVMSGLFKLQVGQGRHWNVYAHSHLMFGINMAETRRKARLAMNSTAKARLVEGIYDPCLPAGGRIEFKTSVHYDKNGIDTWNASVDDFSAVTEPGSSDYGHYHAVLVNNENAGDWEQCKTLARGLLNKESNAWCEFSHHSSCSFVGVYQPELPTQAASFGEFLAFSNYYHVWQFLQLQPRSSLEQIDQQGQQVCSQNWKQMLEYNAKNTNVTLTEEDLATYCFRAAYVHEMLAYGYGFQPNDRITATNVVNGQKVDWALGSILYEINTLPWDYIEVHGAHHIADHMESNMFQNWGSDFTRYLAGVLVVSILALLQIMRVYRRQSRSGSSRRKDGYETLHDTDEIETLTLRV